MSRQSETMAGEDDELGGEQRGAAAPAGDNHVGRDPQTKVPPPLTLEGNKVLQWKLFKKRWNNYMILTNFNTKPREYQIARLENCLADDALELLEGFSFETPEEERTVAEIMDAFERYSLGETNETMERHNFAKRSQKEGETFDRFLADLRTMIKTCGYCVDCTPKILTDRIVLGIISDETREDLLKERKLTVAQCVDICRAQECAAVQSKSLKHETVNQVANKKGAGDHNKREPKKGLCRYCGSEHVFIKTECPAWGRKCTYCDGRNHLEEVCMRKKYARAAKPKDRKESKKDKKTKVNNIAEGWTSESSDEEWVYSVQGPARNRDVKCQMEVNGNVVKFQIDTGSSVNLLPDRYVDASTVSPYKGKLTTWDGTQINAIGTCRATVRNPRTRKKFNVEFLIYKGGLQPLLGLKASKQMQLITVHYDNFDVVSAVKEESLFPDVFSDGIGLLPGIQELKVKPEAIPIVMATRRTPVNIRQELKNELDRLESLGVITPIEEATPWVSQIVIVKKPDGRLRVCIDPHELNKALLREHYEMPILDDILHEIRESKFFSKADLSSGYWHVKLSEESSKMTTFQTCFGRYRWLRLPFGLSVSAEVFQKKLMHALADIPGTICIADDVIIHGKDEETHDKNLKAFLSKCQELGIKLNKKKLEIKKQDISFMGHMITTEGLKADPSKVKAITAMEAPKDTEGLRRVLGIVNYLGKFAPNLATLSHPLTNLLKKDVPWNWSETQDKAFAEIKRVISNAPLLAFYNPSKELVVENDACEYGIGSVLMQEGRPIAYASRSLTSAERNYAQIEKEMLAAVYGLEKFHHYTYGRPVTIITDHKPLESIARKPLGKAPRRLQSLLLRARNYTHHIVYQPGKSIPTADALSRAPVEPAAEANDIDAAVHNVVLHRLRNTKLDEIRGATAKDPTLIQLGDTIRQGWPENKRGVPEMIRAFYDYRDELVTQDGVIYRGDRVVIPKTMQSEMKQKVHAGHLGINACLRRARDLIYWPGMSKDIRQHVETCATCAAHSTQQPQETIIHGEAPNRPWQKVGSDLFKWEGREYIIVTDYYSNFFEMEQIEASTSSAVIKSLKKQFARHGIPTNLVSDNGAQYTSADFKAFTNSWGIEHSTISPGNSQANGAAEAAVKTAKRLMDRCKASGEDIHLALINHRNTPSEGLETSPAQRLFGRRTSTLVPTAEKKLQAMMPIKQGDDVKVEQRRKQLRHGTDLKPLCVGDNIRMQPIQKGEKLWKEGQVVTDLGSRSYEVETHVDGTRYRRNRRFLRKTQRSSHTEVSTTPRPRRMRNRVVNNETETPSPNMREINNQDQGPPPPEVQEKPSNDSDCPVRPGEIQTRSGRCVVKRNYKIMNSEGQS